MPFTPFLSLVIVVKVLVIQYSFQQTHQIWRWLLAFLFPFLYVSNRIYDKYSNQAKSIVKNVIVKEYPDATEFEFELGEGYFVENGINYDFEYQKNISGKEKLIVINDKQIKTLDIPKESKSNESTNN